MYIRVLRSCRCIHYPPTSAHPTFSSLPSPSSSSSVPRFQPPRVFAGRPCGDEHRKMCVIKGKIFLCPAIGGCHGNTQATSASNYFQTLRIERALLRTARIAQHTHFSRISRSLPVLTIQQPSSFLRRFPPFRSLPYPCAILVFEGVDC